MSRSTTQLNQVKEGTKRSARQAAASPWTERLARFGYIVRGVVYIIPGLLGLQLALGVGGAAVNQTGAIGVIAANPFGKVLLVLVAIGLVGYSLWGFIRAIYDPFREGSDIAGLAKRFGYIVSAFGYAVLLIATLQYIQGAVVTSNNPQDWSAKLLTMSIGRVIVGIVGAGWMIGGLHQLYVAYTSDFKDEFKTNQMTAWEKKWSFRIARFGLASRGVAFALIGLFLIQAAVFTDPNRAKALDGVLLTLARQPYGPVLLAIVSLGLIAFGIYSILLARWAKIRVSASRT